MHTLEPAFQFMQNLERQLAEAREKIDRQAERIRYLEGATGTPLSKAREQRDRLADVLRKAVAHPITGDWFEEAEEALAAVKEVRQ